MRTERTSRVLAALASPMRLKAVAMLRGGPLCVRTLARRLGVSDSAASQHLAKLRAAGLIRGRRRGYFIHYELDAAALADARKRIDAALAPPTTETRSCCGKPDACAKSQSTNPRSRPCAATSQSARSPKASKASPKTARRSR